MSRHPPLVRVLTISVVRLGLLRGNRVFFHGMLLLLLLSVLLLSWKATWVLLRSARWIKPFLADASRSESGASVAFL